MPSIPHRQMGGTADGPAPCQRLPAESISEFGLHTNPPRLNPWQRLKRWWRVGQLKAEIADLEADEDALLADLSEDAALKLAHPERWQDDTVQELHLSTLGQLADVRKRLDAKCAEIHFLRALP